MSNTSCSTPKDLAADRVSRARSTAEVQCVCQHPLSPQLGLGSCFCGIIETWPLYKNCSISKKTSYPTEFTGMTTCELVEFLGEAGPMPIPILDPNGSDPDPVGESVPPEQKNFLKKRLRAARMQRWAWTILPSTLKVTSLKACPLISRFR